MFFIKLSLFISSKSSKNSQQFLLLNVASQVIHFNVNLINLKDDQKELFIKEHKYYKSLKRLLIIAKINGDLKLMVKLTDLFNSAVGKLYVLKNQLDACMLLLETIKNKYPVSRPVFTAILKPV